MSQWSSTRQKVNLQVLHRELHRSDRIGWLRAAVLGANDGIVSTASLVVGVASARATSHDVLVAGVAGLAAGAMSMAAGEYVSVSSQADTELADLAIEKRELAADSGGELLELTRIYEKRGLDSLLANQVAQQLTAKGALVAHARDELGITDTSRARPKQAALASAATFAVGAAVPLLAAALSPSGYLIPLVAGTSLACLALLGVAAAFAGGASTARGALRVTFWGALAMASTAGVGALFGAVG
jgi:VIT1/CCC1 family predicted Fe2+/Mn2+ transporter